MHANNDPLGVRSACPFPGADAVGRPFGVATGHPNKSMVHGVNRPLFLTKIQHDWQRGCFGLFCCSAKDLSVWPVHVSSGGPQRRTKNSRSKLRKPSRRPLRKTKGLRHLPAQQVGTIRSADDDASSNVMPVIREIQRASANFLHQIADTLNRAWITAPRGGTWYAKSVSNVLARD